MAEIEGYRTVIHGGLWKRVLTKEMPYQWFGALMGVGILEAIVLIGFFRWKGLILLTLVILGQYVSLRWLTACDIQWDEILFAQLTHRYRDYYDG